MSLLLRSVSNDMQLQALQVQTAAAAAAAAADDDMPHLPIEVLALIAKTMPRIELAALRLSSTQFAAAITPLLDSITVREWPDKACSLKRLQHATRLNLDISLPGNVTHDALIVTSSSSSSGDGSNNSMDDSSIDSSCSACTACAANAEDLWQQLQQLVS
jgi:hypothetical protein